MKHPRLLKVDKSTFKFDSEHPRKHGAIQMEKKLKLQGFKVRIKQQNPYLIYKGKKTKKR